MLELLSASQKIFSFKEKARDCKVLLPSVKVGYTNKDAHSMNRIAKGKGAITESILHM